MSCLALSLQSTDGSDILLQTREWFPPARAMLVLSVFRQTRIGKNQNTGDDDTSLGDDPLSASSGQVIVGVESRYRVIYRLVNFIYVLGITTVDDDCMNNVFECINTVNQAVDVIVIACRGVDVTIAKLVKKYEEIYMALDIVLRGVSNIKLASMLASLHADSVAKIVRSASSNDDWISVEIRSREHETGESVFTNTCFELLPETLEAGDEVAVTLARAEYSPSIEQYDKKSGPFGFHDNLNNPVDLVDGFKKDKEHASDLSTMLSCLEVITTLPSPADTESTRIGVEGFEGDYGGLEFSQDGSTLRDDFEGINQAWGGGLDASEFVNSTIVAKPEGLGGLELLGSNITPTTKLATRPNKPLVLKKPEMKGPEIYISEVINAEFRESLLARIGLMGFIYLKTNSETKFSFKIENINGIKRVIINNSIITNLGNQKFHVKTGPSYQPIPIMKYSFLPRAIHMPLRVRLVKRQSGTLLSVMIQYVSNPDLFAPLTDVMFVLKLPVDPKLLIVKPKAVLNRFNRELQWHVDEIPLKGNPGRLRVRMTVDANEEDGYDDEIEVVGYVKFSYQGTRSLSGVSIQEVNEGKMDFCEVLHRYESGVYACN